MRFHTINQTILPIENDIKFDGPFFITDTHLSEFHILVVKLCSTLAKNCSDQQVKIVDLAVNEPKLDGS